MVLSTEPRALCMCFVRQLLSHWAVLPTLPPSPSLELVLLLSQHLGMHHLGQSQSLNQC